MAWVKKMNNEISRVKKHNDVALIEIGPFPEMYT